MSIPQSFVQELLARTDVVEVVGRYTQLKKGGANFMGLCPFHGEKSASFSVSPVKQFYHCFGCGANGNAISFLMEHVGMGFVEAIQELAQQAGLSVPEENATPQDRANAHQQREQQASLTQVLEQVARAYQKQLKTTPRAVAYLKGRGLSGEIAKTFGLGYAPEGWRALASLIPHYSDPRLVESGLVIATEAVEAEHLPHKALIQEGKRYDRFRDRIMFPIRNVKGETIGFGGRVLDKGEPKYLNSPETPVFTKGSELYGLFESRTAIRVNGYALVTEGYMDVVALAQLGFANAVATLGTACTSEHIQKLLRFTDAVIFSFDGDKAGRRAANKAMVAALPFAQDTRRIKFLFLPPEHDPDSFIRANGQSAFAQCVKEAMPLSRFMLETAAADCDLTTAEGRALMASNARPLWHALPDGALKLQMLGELAQQIGLGAGELTDLWRFSAGSRTLSNFRGLERSDAEQGLRGNFGIHRSSPNNAHLSESARNYESAPKGAKNRHSGSDKGFREQGHRSAHGARSTPTSRADLVARTLLGQPQAWNWLTSEDHQLLGLQPEPFGQLFVWLEEQWHEHGPQPWAVLQQAIMDKPFATFATQLIAQAQTMAAPVAEDGSQSQVESEAELRREMREMLNRMLIEDLKQRENWAIAAANSDPTALQTYRSLRDRRKELMLLVEPSKV